MSQIITNINNLINEQVLVPIVEYLKSKGIKDIDVATLQGVLNIPTQSTKTKGIRAPKHRDSAIVTDPEAKCEYEYTKGGNKGKKCGKPCVKGYNYCSLCIKKSGTKKKLEEQNIELPPWVAEKAKDKPINKGVKEKKQKEADDDDDAHGMINAQEVEGKKGFYISMEKDLPVFYFKLLPNGRGRVYGIYEDDEVRPLNEKELQIAEEKNFEVVDIDELVKDEKEEEVDDE